MGKSGDPSGFIPASWERQFQPRGVTYQDPTLQPLVVYSGGDDREAVLGYTHEERPPNPQQFEEWKFTRRGHGKMLRAKHPEQPILAHEDRQPISQHNMFGPFFGTDKFANKFGNKQ